MTSTTGAAGVRAEVWRERRAAIGEFRRSEVLVPVVDGSLLSAEAGGIRWLFAFTDVQALERFAEARGEAVPDRVPVYGARLLDQVIVRVDGPAGIAVDAGSPKKWWKRLSPTAPSSCSPKPAGRPVLSGLPGPYEILRPPRGQRQTVCNSAA
ncbi:SseB family protein [Streptomyces canus]|uniref:SseB family protein n=1 Tax=Streptomyces canus TaxID=58343 RepID=UPI0036BCA16A